MSVTWTKTVVVAAAVAANISNPGRCVLGQNRGQGML